MNPYYRPEDYGLEIVGTIEWGSGGYEYDQTTVWVEVDPQPLRVYSPMFYVGDSSGCSCSSPFDSTGLQDLEKFPAGSALHDIRKRLEARHVRERENSWHGDTYSRTEDILNLLDRMRAKGAW